MGAGGLDKEDPQCGGGEERGWLQVGECGGGMCGGRQEKNKVQYLYSVVHCN